MADRSEESVEALGAVLAHGDPSLKLGILECFTELSEWPFLHGLLAEPLLAVTAGEADTGLAGRAAGLLARVAPRAGLAAEATDALMERLAGEQEVDLQMSLVEAIGDLAGTDQPMPGVLAEMAAGPDDEHGVRLMACAALVKLTGDVDTYLPPLVDALAAADDATAEYFLCDLLIWIGPDAKPAGDVLANPRDRRLPSFSRLWAVTAVGYAGEDGAAWLASLVRDEAVPLAERQDAVRAMGSLHADAERATAELMALWLEAEPELLPLVAHALGKLGRREPGAIEFLERATEHTEVLVRLAALEALGRLRADEGNADLVERLLTWARSDEPDRRWEAAASMGELAAGADLCVPVLTALCEDPDEPVRWKAVEALGRFGPEAASAAATLARALSLRLDDWQIEALLTTLSAMGPGAAAARPWVEDLLAAFMWRRVYSGPPYIYVEHYSLAWQIRQTLADITPDASEPSRSPDTHGVGVPH